MKPTIGLISVVALGSIGAGMLLAWSEDVEFRAIVQAGLIMVLGGIMVGAAYALIEFRRNR